MNITDIDTKLKEIETDAYNLQQMSYNITKQYVEELDSVINSVAETFKGIDNVDVDVLSQISIQLSLALYNVSVYVEYAGLQEDLARLSRKEKYNTELAKATGRVVDKQSAAELGSIQETLIQSIAESCYKQIKGRLDYGTELLQSIKKIITLRISSIQIKE